MLALFLALAALAAPPAGAKAVPVDFPLSQGTVWTYAGTARWTADGNRVRKGPVGFTVEVREVVAREGFRLALVQGWPHDCTGWESEVPSKAHLVVEVPERGLYEIEASPDLERRLAEPGRITLDGLKLAADQLFLVPGLAKSVGFGDPEQLSRKDAMYAWHVEGEPLVDLTKLRLGKKKGFSIALRTLPDHMIEEFVPGVGITAFEYVHHGTVAECAIRLVALEKGPAR